MANPDKAEREGFERGIQGKSVEITKGWTDTEKEREARSRGVERGREERARIEAEKKSRRDD